MTMNTTLRYRAFLLAAGILALSLWLPGCAPRDSALPPAPQPVSEQPTATPTPDETSTAFAIIGDYGTGDGHERDVAKMVGSWDPDFVVTVGDNYYDSAGGNNDAERYDRSVRDSYARWLDGDFFPTLGNHDYKDVSLEGYRAYFDLPGNERYYEFVRGPVHVFVLNSNEEEPDGTDEDSAQAQWLKTGLAQSTAAWNIVVAHHPPHSSEDEHGSSRYMRWPYAEWGADAVVSGHAHNYERVMRSGTVFFVNGSGGAKLRGFKADPAIGSEARYDDDWGAQRVTATAEALTFEFYSVDGQLQDRYELEGVPSGN